MRNIKFIKPFEDRTGKLVVDCTSRSSTWSKGLSPFFLGPVDLPWRDPKTGEKRQSLNMENAWQYSKVYDQHLEHGEVGQKWLEWARQGWENSRAVRYPIGKGVKPLYSYWQIDGKNVKLARKAIYVPLYAQAVVKTEAFWKLEELYVPLCNADNTLYLADFDVYQTEDLEAALENKTKKFGHAFVLAALLQERLKEFTRCL